MGKLTLGLPSLCWFWDMGALSAAWTENALEMPPNPPWRCFGRCAAPSIRDNPQAACCLRLLCTIISDHRKRQMIFMGVPVPVDSMSIAMQPTIIFVKHTRNYWIFPHIHFAPYRHGWWGRWFPPRPRLGTRHTEGQEETFTWCLRSLPQTKEYELITSVNTRLIHCAVKCITRHSFL